MSVFVKNGVRVFICFLASTMLSNGATKVPRIQTYEPTWESVTKHNPQSQSPEWLQDGKFGIYFHWGPYSIPAFKDKNFGEWYPKWMNVPGTKENAYHIEHYGDPSEWPYRFFIDGAKDKKGNWVKFAPKLKSLGGEFDPDEWAALFAKAGARFAGPCAEHCDGFSMWRSQCNEWNAFDRCGIDIVGEIVAALRRQDMKIFTSFHHAYSLWNYYPEDHADYWPAKGIEFNNRSVQKLHAKLPLQEQYALWEEKIKEVVDQYQPDYVYHDFGMRALPEQSRLNHLAYYYNQAQRWGKDVVVTYKNHEFVDDAGIRDFEGGCADDVTSYNWVTDQNMAHGTWGYVEGMKNSTATELLHTLISNVSKNGALMLNVSPKADGTIPAEQQAILLEMGAWLGTFGECIYNTRSWEVYGEGSTETGAGKGAVKLCTAKDIRFTRNKENTVLYAILCGWPQGGGSVNIASLKKDHIQLADLKRVELIHEGSEKYESVKFHQDKDGLKVQLPAQQPRQQAAYPLKLTFAKQIPKTKEVLTAAPMFYMEENYKGKLTQLQAGKYAMKELEKAGIKNDSLASLRVHKGWKVILYDGNFSGESLTVSSLTFNLKHFSVDLKDKVSSVEVIRER